MRLPSVLVLFLLPAFAWPATVRDEHERLAEGVVFPSEDELEAWRSDGRWYRTVVDIVVDREHWARAVAEIEDRLGMTQEDLQVTVTMHRGEASNRAAEGGGENGVGWVRFHMGTLVDYAERIAQFERQARDPRAVVLVPPTYVNRMIWHEMTHVYQNGLDSPDWFREGMACYVERNESHLKSFIFREVPLTDLEGEIDHDNSYARGWMFWNWIEDRHRAAGVRDLARRTCVDRQDWREAIEEVTGLTWDQVVALEFQAAREYHDRERQRMDRLRRGSDR